MSNDQTQFQVNVQVLAEMVMVRKG